jgi:DDE superfamily endonuclease
MDRCARAILDCNALAHSFPKTAEQIKVAASGFAGLSSNNFLRGCVGAVDGLLIRIKVPATIAVGMVKSFYSGHYQCYGVNIQAVCDHRCRFIEVCVAAPGGANDIAAFRKTYIPALINNLPGSYYIVGDNAYICTEHLLTPYSGTAKKIHRKTHTTFMSRNCVLVLRWHSDS